MKFSKSIVKGDLRTLARISIPLLFFLFFETFTLFCERIFLSYHSIESVSAALNANYLAQIFQSPCITIAMMAQIFVGMYQGSGQYQKIGSCIWQLIWFSLLSMAITLPLSYQISALYFKNSVIEKAGIDYFAILAWGNFLFPLSTALSSFYLGRGKTILVTTLMLGSYGLQLLLSWGLIFGLDGILPALGMRGAGLARCLSLSLLSLTLMSCFLRRKNRQEYGTGKWYFSPRALGGYIRSGSIRAFGYFSTKIWWGVICYIMIRKGGMHLDVLTVGGTVASFLVFIPSSTYKATLTIASNLLGAGKFVEIKRLSRSFVVFTLSISAFLLIPFLCFPETFLYFFSTSSHKAFIQTFHHINIWVWFYVFALTMQMNFCALLVVLKELKFQLYCYLFLWALSPIAVYFGIGWAGWDPKWLWLIMALESTMTLIVFLIRLHQIKREQEKDLSASLMQKIPI